MSALSDRHILVYDTTLRDGAQREGVSLSLEDKLRIAARLDELGVDFIEGGFIGSNPKDEAFFAAFETPEALEAFENGASATRGLRLSHAQLVAFGLPVRRGMEPRQDPALQRLVGCSAPIISLVSKASSRQVVATLQITPSENLAMLADSITYARSCGKRVFVVAEHYFDGYAQDGAYALELLVAAAEAGAEYLVLADTNGGTLPANIAAITQDTVQALAARGVRLPVGIHTHDDAGCAVAGALAAVQAGASMVQGTVNGYGERVGNCNLLTLIANLELKGGYRTIGPQRLRLLTGVSRFVADTMSIRRNAFAPYVGANAFSHKGGLHVSAKLRLQDAYEHVDPEAVGNTAHMVMSELAGRAALSVKTRDLGLGCGELAPKQLDALLARIKEREALGYSYEAADASLALLILEELGQKPQYFSLESLRVITERRPDGGEATEATIKIHVGEERFIATAEGNGPVNALDAALRTAITRFYPQIQHLELCDFKVRVLDGSTGTGAVTRVFIETATSTQRWGTVGVHTNIIEASWDALVDAITYGLLKEEEA